MMSDVPKATTSERERAPERTSDRTTERGEATRRHILDAAAACFAKHGYAGTSLSELIADAGLTKGGFYFHFPSKEALALAVIADKQEAWTVQVSAAALGKSRGIEQLRAMADRLCDLHEQDPTFGCVGRLIRELGMDPALAPQIHPMAFATWVQLLVSLLQRAQAEGDVRRDLDPVAVAETAVAAFIGLKDISDMLSGGTDLRDRMAVFSQVFVAGLAAR